MTKMPQAKPKPSLEIRNDIAEYYDRLANMTDYTKEYGRRLITPQIKEIVPIEAYYARACDYGYLTYDDFMSLYENSLESAEAKSEIAEMFDDLSDCTTVNQLAQMNMKSFKPSSRPLKRAFKVIEYYFSDESLPRAPRRPRMALPHDFSLFRHSFENNFAPYEKPVYIEDPNDPLPF